MKLTKEQKNLLKMIGRMGGKARAKNMSKPERIAHAKMMSDKAKEAKMAKNKDEKSFPQVAK